MRLHWMTAALLSTALAAGCGSPADQNAQNSEANGATAAAPANDSAPRADQVSPNRDTAAPPATSDTARPRTGPGPAPSRQTTDTRNSSRPLDRTPRDEDRSAAGTAARRETERSATRAERTETLREVRVISGTALPLELMTPLSSETAQVETPVRARLRNSILVDGVTAIPAGTVFTGSVTDVADAGRVKGRSRLAFRFDEATIHGVRERLQTNALVFEGETSKGEDATKIGAGAGIGAAIGGILGGGKGAAKGAVIGGAAGTGAVLATKGKDVMLAEGTDLAVTLADSISVRVPAR